MIPAVIDGHERTIGKPKDWDDAVSGPCLGLPIRGRYERGLHWMESAWQPSPSEVEAIRRGACIILSISAPAHPVVSLGVGPVPGQGDVVDIRYARAGQTPNGHMMEVWDETTGRPVNRSIYEVDLDEGWIKVYRVDAMGNPTHDADDNPQFDTLRGNFSLRWK